MTSTIQLLVVLLGVVAAVAVLATRLKTPASILLVLTGVALALIPGLPSVELAPEAVLLLVLPPVIYASAVAMSWREFRFNLRPIAMLAVGCVLFTTAGVAAAAHWLLGLSWPVGFLLGAIVSPPDTMAPLSIARRLEIPRRILVVLEGEGLANDATALILYRFAVGAVSAGVFSFGGAAGLLAAPSSGRIGRPRDSDGGALYQLERPLADQRRDPPARDLLLGFFHLSYRRHGVPHYGASGADFDRPHRRSFGSRTRHISRSRQRRGDPNPLHLDVSRNLSSAPALSASKAPRSLAALAMAVCLGVHGRPRHRFARGRARDPAHGGKRRAFSRPRSHPLPDFRRDPGNPRWPGADAAFRHPHARPRACRTIGAPLRHAPRVQGSPAGDRSGHRAA